MEIKPISPKEIIENSFSARTVSIVNDILEERFAPGKPVKIKFSEFCDRWDDYTNCYKKLIKKEFNSLDELYVYYGWSVNKEDNTMIFERRFDWHS